MTFKHTPLAERSRPKNINDIAGHEAILAPGKPLRALIEKDRFTALLFWGPPGVGKTTLAHTIAAQTQRHVEFLSAVHASVKDLRRCFEQSKTRIDLDEPASLLFLDEVHRLSKSQQDVLLPALESGEIRFIGATTENPSFEVNRAVLSRCLVFRLEKLKTSDIESLLRRALEKAGISEERFCTPDVFQRIAHSSQGDARRALNLLEALIAIFETQAESKPFDDETLDQLGDIFPREYDKKNDAHYDTISAFIKSIRASDPNAAVYYLARMLDGGEDPMFIARRLLIVASEDIGNASPTALILASAASQAVHMVGMPEARIILSQATTYLASSPKSNRSYLAINTALEDVKQKGALEIPKHLRNAPTEFMKNQGYGRGYIYAHDNPKAANRMPNLPSEVSGKKYYEPSTSGAEKQIRDNLAQLAAKP